MHYTPKTVSAEDPVYTHIYHVRSRFADNALMAGSGNAWFPDHALGAGCARWAVQSARAFGDEFVAVIGCKANYQIARSRPKAGVNGAGHRFCFETYQVIEERTYARACTSIAD